MKNRIKINCTSLSLDEKIDFFTELYTYINSSIPISTGLTNIINNSSSKKINYIASTILKLIDNGENFSDSVLRFENIIGSAYCNLLAAGYETGELPRISKEILETLKKQRSIKRNIIKSCAYPITLLIVFCIATLAMIFIIIPKVSAQAELMTGKIPLSLQIISKGWIFIFAFIIFIAYMGIRLFKNMLKGKSVLQIPVLGKAVKEYNLSSFLRVLSLSYKAGIPIASAFTLSSKIIQNNYIKNRLILNSSMLAKGASLSDTLRTTGLFEPQTISKIETGEISGNLEEIFNDIVKNAEEHLETTLSAAMSMIEPAFIFIIGIFILLFGFIILGPANPFNYF